MSIETVEPVAPKQNAPEAIVTDTDRIFTVYVDQANLSLEPGDRQALLNAWHPAKHDVAMFVTERRAIERSPDLSPEGRTKALADLTKRATAAVEKWRLPKAIADVDQELARLEA